MRIPQRLQVAVVGLLFLDGELLDGIGSHFERDFDHLWVLDGSGDLVAADGPAFQSPVSGFDLALGMSHLDEVTPGRRTLDSSCRDAKGVAAWRQLLFLMGNDDATGAVSELQVGASVAVRQSGVVLVIGEVAPVGIGITSGSFFRVAEAEVFGIRHPLEPVGISVKAIGVIDETLGFSNLGDECLVLGSLGGFVHAFLPFGKSGIFILDLRDFFLVRRIDGFSGSTRVTLDSVLSASGIGPSSSTQSTQIAGGVP